MLSDPIILRGEQTRNRGRQKDGEQEGWSRLRKLALAVIAVAPGLGFAQVSALTPEQTINQAFGNLSGVSDLTVRMIGTDRSGTQIAYFQNDVVWHQKGYGDTRTVYLSVKGYINNQLVFEARGNGKTLYTYNHLARTYKATPYHIVTNPQKPEVREDIYAVRLVSALQKAGSALGPDSYLARFLSDAFSPPAGFTMVGSEVRPRYYHSWFPTAAGYELTATIPPTTYPDSVVPQGLRSSDDVRLGYTPTETERYIGFDTLRQQTVMFHLHQPEGKSGPEEISLQRIFFGEISKSGRNDRLLEWTMYLTYPIVGQNDGLYELQFNPRSDVSNYRAIVAPGAPRG